MAGGPRYRIGARHTATRPYPGMKTAAVTGLPKGTLPGALGARTAALKRAQGVPTPAPIPEPKPDIKCALDYLVLKGVDKLGQFLLNKLLHAERPSWIDPPLKATCFERHVGTGNAASGDLSIDVLPGGAPTLIMTFTVPNLFRGVIKELWTLCDQGPVANEDVAWRLVVNGRRVTPFDNTYGAAAAGATGDYAGFPYGPTNPNRNLCVLLKGGDVVQLQALNFGINIRSVRASMAGWVFQPTVFETGETVRAFMTDQQ